MKKRIISALMCIGLSLSVLPTTSLALESEKAANAEDYLRLGDYVTIVPAEDKNGTVTSTTWAINVQDGGHINGQDIQMWDMGTSVKFCVRRYDQNKKAFALIPTNFRESEDSSSTGKFWDLEGRKTNSGTTIHVWEDDDLNDDNKLFYVEPDGDGDPETFYLCSYYARDKASRYLVPESYHSNGTSWASNGRNIVLSSDKFRWRVQVLNRDAGDVNAAWMNKISDDTLLAQVNIPGTHDTGTANVEGSWNENFNIVACQKYFIDEQLYAGVRAMDIRYAYNEHSKSVVLVHGNGNTICHNKDHGSEKGSNMTLESVLKTSVDFLQSHPSETIIMTVKQDDSNSSAPAEMAKIFTQKTYSVTENGKTVSYPYTHFCYDWSKASPTLGDVRGKLVIMTRTSASSLSAGDSRKYFGPDISNWDNSYDDDTHFAQRIYGSDNAEGGIWIQDDYECSDNNKKMQFLHVLEQLNKPVGSKTSDGTTIPNKPGDTDFVFNYTSKTTSDSQGASPLGGARIMNKYVTYDGTVKEYFAGSQRYRSGITVMDYVDKPLAYRIINSNFVVPARKSTYTDVSENDWFHDAVYSASQYGYFAGIGNNQFAPQDEMTRAALAQVLYNIEGKPMLTDEMKNSFTDVSADQWYTDAVVWATSEGIAKGYGNGKFGPNDALTREQAVQIMYNYAARNGYFTTGSADLKKFTDAATVSDWANTAMQWAVSNNVIAGTNTGSVLPQNTVTRAQMAQITVRFHELYFA